jgi:CheY-like chemotaxis protein
VRVLACTIQGTQARLRAVLPDAELHLVYTSDEALRLLRQHRFDLVMIGLRFDESRGLELPGRILTEGLEMPPFVGLRGARTAAAISPQAFDLPMWALGARDVIDFGAIPDNDTGNRHIAERLARCVR